MTSVSIFPLGAGQDVGRSCIIAQFEGLENISIMFDCGLHMTETNQRFPDFSKIPRQPPKGENIVDLVLITHFHLDHCGAFPYFVSSTNYTGQIYMSRPTKALSALLIEDYIKVSSNQIHKTPNEPVLTRSDILRAFRRVVPVQLFQTLELKIRGIDVTITPYYAGHVLGACMFHVTVGPISIVYTGDYNMFPDRHLGSAWIPRLKPDILITESTYATTIRDSKRSREMKLLTAIKDTISRRGKVLIPVFALGRAQELCILIESFWSQYGLNVPIYYSSKLTQNANQYYRLFLSWTNYTTKIGSLDNSSNSPSLDFNFKHISHFDSNTTRIDQEGPMILFATPGMLHAGMSLDVFQEWCDNPNNTVILPGYCAIGTIGSKILSNRDSKSQIIPITSKKSLTVRCAIRQISFSAHADRLGILQLISQLEPKNVILVHGEKENMPNLAGIIRFNFGIDVFYPQNYQDLHITTQNLIPVKINPAVIFKSVTIPTHLVAESFPFHQLTHFPLKIDPFQYALRYTAKSLINIDNPSFLRSPETPLIIKANLNVPDSIISTESESTDFQSSALLNSNSFLEHHNKSKRGSKADQSTHNNYSNQNQGSSNHSRSFVPHLGTVIPLPGTFSDFTNLFQNPESQVLDSWIDYVASYPDVTETTKSKYFAAFNTNTNTNNNATTTTDNNPKKNMATSQRKIRSRSASDRSRESFGTVDSKSKSQSENDQTLKSQLTSFIARILRPWVHPFTLELVTSMKHNDHFPYVIINSVRIVVFPPSEDIPDTIASPLFQKLYPNCSDLTQSSISHLSSSFGMRVFIFWESTDSILGSKIAQMIKRVFL